VSHAEGKKRPPTVAVRNLAGLGVVNRLTGRREKRLLENPNGVFLAPSVLVCPWHGALAVAYLYSDALAHRERR